MASFSLAIASSPMRIKSRARFWSDTKPGIFLLRELEADCTRREFVVLRIMPVLEPLCIRRSRSAAAVPVLDRDHAEA
jgi:hypothetical protein